MFYDLGCSLQMKKTITKINFFEFLHQIYTSKTKMEMIFIGAISVLDAQSKKFVILSYTNLISEPFFKIRF